MPKFMRYKYRETPKRGRPRWELDIFQTRRGVLKMYAVQGKLLPRVEWWHIFTEGVDPEYDQPGYIYHSIYVMKESKLA